MPGRPVRILSADFVITAVEPAGWPKSRGPEIAFAGRSNVGKSSMINALCQRKKLVRVSNTPGRTRALNFFDVVLEDEDGARREVRLCDLPGYGFAKASKAERVQWRKMIESYVQGREGLCAVVCIVDAEVGLSEEDARVVPWVQAAGREVIVAATKLDRLPKHRKIPQLCAIEDALDRARGNVVGVSATDGVNLDVLWHRILTACAFGQTAVEMGPTSS